MADMDMDLTGGRGCTAKHTCVPDNTRTAHVALRGANNKFYAVEKLRVHDVIARRVKCTNGVDDPVSMSAIDENTHGRMGMNLFLDSDGPIDLPCDEGHVAVSQYEMITTLTKMADVAMHMCIYDGHSVSPTVRNSAYSLSGTGRLQVMLHPAEALSAPPTTSYGVAYGSMAGTRKDKRSMHGLAKPVVPIASRATVKLIVITTLASIMSEAVVSYRSRVDSYPHEKGAALDDLRLAISNVCSIDLNPYSSDEPHLRLPTTTKANIPGSNLVPLCLIQDTVCTTRPDTEEGAKAWLSSISGLCTINYITSTPVGDTELIALEDPSSLSIDYLRFCKDRIVDAQNCIRVPAYTRLVNALDFGMRAKHDALVSTLAAHLSHVQHITQSKIETATWDAMKSFSARRCNDNGDCFVMRALEMTAYHTDLRSLIATALFTRTKRLRFFRRNPQSNFPDELNQEDADSTRSRIREWRPPDMSDIRFSYCATNSQRSYLPAHHSDSFSLRGKLNVNSTTCVWKKHKSATVIIDYSARHDFNGRFFMSVQIGCWNAEGCNRPMHVLIDTESVALAEELYTKAAAQYSTVVACERLVDTCPPPMIALSEYNHDDLSANAMALATHGVSAVSGKLERLRPMFQQISKCMIVTRVELDQTKQGQWSVQCTINKPPHKQGDVVRTPIAPKWTDDEFKVFTAWANNSVTENKLGVHNPGLLYLGAHNEIKAFTYMTNPDRLHALVAKTLGVEDTNRINQIAPISAFSDAHSLVGLQIMIHMCRPLTTSALQLVYVHRKCFTALDTHVGGPIRGTSEVDRLMWSGLLGKVYNEIIHPQDGEERQSRSELMRLSLVTSPQIPAERSDHGGSCLYSMAQRCVEHTRAPLHTICKSESMDSSNLGNCAFGIADLLTLERWFRHTMQLVMQDDMDTEQLRIQVSCFASGAHRETSRDQGSDDAFDITITPNWFGSDSSESVLRYPLWVETSTSGVVAHAATWPRVSDTCFEQKQIHFQQECERLIAEVGSERLPVSRLVIEDAELFSSLDAYIQLCAMQEKGLIRLSATDAGDSAVTRIVAKITAHRQPGKGQIGAPWLLAATEWGMKQRTTYGGRTYGQVDVVHTDTAFCGYPLASELGWLHSKLTGNDRTICFNEFVTIHVTAEAPTRLPDEFVCQSAPASTQPTKKKKKKSAPTSTVDGQSPEPPVAADEVVVLSAHASRQNGVSLMGGLPLCRPIEACDAMRGLPTHTVMFTDYCVSVHDVVRVLACMHRQHTPAQPTMRHLHVVTSAQTARGGKKRYVNDFYKADSNQSHTVASPVCTANADGTTSGVKIGWENHWFGQ